MFSEVDEQGSWTPFREFLFIFLVWDENLGTNTWFKLFLQLSDKGMYIKCLDQEIHSNVNVVQQNNNNNIEKENIYQGPPCPF